MNIYVGFSRPTTSFPIFAWFIQWVEKRPYDHAYIRFSDPTTQKQMIFQASKNMVNLYSYPIFLQYNKPIKEYTLDIDNVHYNDLWNYITDNLGIPYGLKIDFGIFLMKIIPFLKSNPFSDNNEEVCSVLAAKVCAMLGITIPEDFDSVDPSYLDNLLSQNNLPCQVF